MKTSEIIKNLKAAGFVMDDNIVLAKNGKDTLGALTFGYPTGRVSTVEEGFRYTVEENGVKWNIDVELNENKPNHKVVRKVKIHNHIANA